MNAKDMFEADRRSLKGKHNRSGGSTSELVYKSKDMYLTLRKK